MAKKIRKKNRWARKGAVKEFLIEKALAAVALLSVIFLALVFYVLLSGAIPAFQTVNVFDFLTGTVWNPANPDFPLYGMLPLFVGTLLVSLGAAVIAIPIGIGCTIYLAELAHPKIKAVFKPAIEVLAGIPSVVYGFFALVILSTWIFDLFHSPSKLNALNGAVILSVMMIPIMVSIAEDAMNAVPGNLREASYALGATKWETIRGVVIPASLSGIIAAIILAIGRAVGETMTVLMATGNAPKLTFDIFSSVQTMTASIAIDFGEVAFNSTHYHILFAIGVVLFAMTFVINSIADYVLVRFSEEYK
jgi:phosphate transport system permease protein